MILIIILEIILFVETFILYLLNADLKQWQKVLLLVEGFVFLCMCLLEFKKWGLLP